MASLNRAAKSLIILALAFFALAGCLQPQEKPNPWEGKNTSTGGGAATWWNTSWAYRTPIKLNSTVATNLANFPIYFKINTSALITAGKMNSDCSDIRIVNSSDNGLLPFELEGGTCNSPNMTLIWVGIPNFIANELNNVSIYYGNPYVSSAENATGVWLQYNAVWHFAYNLLDSAGGNYNLTSFGGTMSYDYNVNGGQMGVALRQNTGNAGKAKIKTTAGDSFINVSNFSISMFFVVNTSTTDTGNPRPFYTFYPTANIVKFYSYIFNSSSTTNDVSIYGNFSTYYTNRSNASIRKHVPNYAAVSFDGLTVKNYVNGSLQGNITTAGNLSTGGNCFRIGGYHPGAGDCTGTWSVAQSIGYISELRISKIAMTADWYAAEYATNYSLQAEEIIPGITATLITPANNTILTTSFSTFTWKCSGGNVSYYANLSINGSVNLTNVLSLDSIETSGVVSGLEDAHSYNWNVTCVNESKNATSPTWFFNVSIAPTLIVTQNLPRLIFFPATKNSKNVSAFGQTSIKGIFNLSAVGTSTATISCNTPSCVTLKCAPNWNQTDLATCFSYPINFLSMTNGQNATAWCWADFNNCTSSSGNINVTIE